MKITFYFGFHTGQTGDAPEHQDEYVEEVEMDVIKASKLLRALREAFKYLTIGEG